MTCRAIDASTRETAKSLEDMYSSEGVLRGADDSKLAPPRTFRPAEIAAEKFPYLTGADNRSLNLSILYTNGGAALQCLLEQAGYNAARGGEIHTEVQGLATKEEQETHLAGLSALDQRTYSIFKTLRLVDYFRGEGNKDRNRDVISAREVEGWAFDYTNGDLTKYQELGGMAISRMHALLGLAHFLGTEPPPGADAGATGAGAVCECTDEQTQIDTLLEQIATCGDELQGRQADIDHKLDEIIACNEENGRQEADIFRLQSEAEYCDAQWTECLVQRDSFEADNAFCWSVQMTESMQCTTDRVGLEAEIARLQRENDTLRSQVVPPPPEGPGTDLPIESLPDGVPDSGIPGLE